MKSNTVKKKYSATKGKPGMKKVVQKIRRAVNKIIKPKEVKMTRTIGEFVNPKADDPVYLRVDRTPRNTAYPYSMHTFTNDVAIFTRIIRYPNESRVHAIGIDGQYHFNGYFQDSWKVELATAEEIVVAKKQRAAHILKDPIGGLAHHFTIGADPEIFVTSDGKKLLPAFDFLPSKKDAPCIKNNHVYWDGFQAEFDIIGSGGAPTCLDVLVSYIRSGLKQTFEHARKKYPEASLLNITTVDIDPVVLADAKDIHVQFGCMPSFNAYGMKGMDLHGREVPFRPAGGHMHFGVGQTTEADALPMVKALDAILGVCSVSMFGGIDDPRRRALYGLAGEYRLPKHGLEYRVLSNAWLFHPLLAYMTFDLGRKALMFGKHGLLEDNWKCTEAETIRIINENDVKAARKVMEDNKDIITMCLTAAYGDSSYGKLAYKAWLAGAEAVVDDLKNISKNWNFFGDLDHVSVPGKRFANSIDLLKKKVG